MMAHSGGDCIGAYRVRAALSGKNWGRRAQGVLGDPVVQRGRGRWIQRGDAVFAALTVDAQMRWFGQVEVLACEDVEFPHA